jgi:hypothetical protein
MGTDEAQSDQQEGNEKNQDTVSSESFSGFGTVRSDMVDLDQPLEKSAETFPPHYPGSPPLRHLFSQKITHCNEPAG